MQNISKQWALRAKEIWEQKDELTHLAIMEYLKMNPAPERIFGKLQIIMHLIDQCSFYVGFMWAQNQTYADLIDARISFIHEKFSAQSDVIEIHEVDGIALFLKRFLKGKFDAPDYQVQESSAQHEQASSSVMSRPVHLFENFFTTIWNKTIKILNQGGDPAIGDRHYISLFGRLAAQGKFDLFTLQQEATLEEAKAWLESLLTEQIMIESTFAPQGCEVDRFDFASWERLKLSLC